MPNKIQTRAEFERWEQWHDASFRNRKVLLKAKKCGCFYCGEVFKPQEIKDWVQHEGTALCPYCRIDAVIPFNKDIPDDQNTLRYMYDYWFRWGTVIDVKGSKKFKPRAGAAPVEHARKW